MDNIKFAIEYLIKNTHKMVEENNNYAVQSVSLAIEALEKQVPKEIKIYDYGKAHCPVCKTDIHGIGKIKYCFHCGQKMDWDR